MLKTMTEADLVKFGKQIKEWRIKNGYTLKELAELINISPRSISSVEKGENVNTKYYIDAFKLMRKKNNSTFL